MTQQSQSIRSFALLSILVLNFDFIVQRTSEIFLDNDTIQHLCQDIDTLWPRKRLLILPSRPWSSRKPWNTVREGRLQNLGEELPSLRLFSERNARSAFQ